MPFESMPYAAPVMYDPRQSNDRITELLMRQGDIAARGAAAQGDIWGNTVAGLGQQAGQFLQQRAEQKAMTKRDQAITSFLDSGTWHDPRAALTGAVKILGPKEGAQFAEALIATSKLTQGQDPAEAMKTLPAIARGLKVAPDTLKPKLYQQVRDLTVKAGLFKPEDLPEQWSPELAPMLDAIANPDSGKGSEPRVVAPGSALVDASGKELYKAPEKAEKPSAPHTQAFGGKVWQYNEQSGKYDIPLGASEAELGRQAAIGKEERTDAKRAEADKVAAQETKTQVDSAFSAMGTALAELEKYAGSSALTSPIEAANARQQYDAATQAFAATLSRATGDNRISDSDRRAYAKLVNYLGPGDSLLKITRPDLIRKRFDEAKKIFGAASDKGMVGASTGGAKYQIVEQ